MSLHKWIKVEKPVLPSSTCYYFVHMVTISMSPNL